MVTVRLKAVVEYDGTDFFGWQKQKDRRTVQGEIEEVFARRFGRRIVVVGAGRTDTGVHALGQVFHCDCPIHNSDAPQRENIIAELHKSLSAMLPPDIVCKTLETAPPGFHARFGAKRRCYRYYIHIGRTALNYRFCWEVSYRLAVGKMRRAVPPLIGEHTFEPFAKLNSKEKHYRCVVYEAALQKRGDTLCFTIIADRFLHGMVRAIVGTLIDVGRGAQETDIFARILETRNRSLVGCLAPAHGLFLEAVEY